MPRVSATAGHPLRDRGEDRQPGRPPTRRLTRRGRPGFDKARYEKRNTVERTINRLKRAGAVAACYDKRGCVFLGTVTVAALAGWLRA
ncbi:hypothetical protein [Streptomyces sp. NPDC051662]|uniref:hypothetical protein n=1 Tax=Streptomyces sp. NPDC051662 TaxID=3154750 RepID=UPI0034232B7C